MMRKQKFYQITTSGRTADINIYGDITADAELINALFETDTGAVSGRGIAQEINDLDVDTINVYINSYGGEVAEALTIYSVLKRHSAQVHTFCDGFACSAATIIFCAGDLRTMGSLALLMIHNCMSYLGYANSNEMRKAAEDNDKINQSSIEAYKKVSNLSEEEIRQMMDDVTWMTAQEALQYGFATEVADQEEDDQEVQQSAFPILRAAILASKRTVDLEPVMQKLEELQAKLDGVVTVVVQEEEDPEEDDPDDPDEDPDDEEETPKEKAHRFFSFMFKEEE